MMNKIYKDKDGNIAGDIITIGDRTYINPPEAVLLKLGFKEVESTSVETTSIDTNVEVEQLRKEQYQLRSDSLFIAYQKNLILGNTEKAEEYKRLWLQEVENIENEYPYITE